MAVIEHPLDVSAFEWDDAVILGPSPGPVVSDRSSRMTAFVSVAVLAACVLAVLFARSFVEEPIAPELAIDPGGALFVYPIRGSGISVDPPGELVRIAAVDPDAVVTAADDELDSTVLADPWSDHDPTGGARFRYTPAESSRPFFLAMLDVVNAPIHIVTVTSIDPQAAIDPLDVDAVPRRIELRGVQGFAVDVADGPHTWSAVAWQMTPGRVAKVVGAASVDELVEVAESLVPVDLYEWLGRSARLEQRFLDQARVLACVRNLGYTDVSMPSWEQFLGGSSDWFWMRDLDLDVPADEWNDIVRTCR